MTVPLRKRTPRGELYTRPAEIEAALAELSALSRDDLLERCKISARSSPGYVPSECLMHFVRASRADNSDRHFEALYKLLIARAFRALPRAESADGKTTSLARMEAREKVIGRFAELLAADRTAYVERLDFFEIRFDKGFARLRQDAQDQVARRERRTTSIDVDEETGELSPEIEKAAGTFDPFSSSEFASLDDRLRLDAAIEALPPLQRRIIEMLRQEIPIDSNDPTVVTIARTLNKGEQTIRRNRNKAYEALRAALGSERS